VNRARFAGLLYLITIVAGVFAEAFARGGVIVRGDAAATAANVAAHETLFRFGLAADLIMLVAYVVVTQLFYELFKPTDQSLSLLAAYFSLIGLAVLSANLLNHIAALTDPSHALFFLKMHSRGYNISGVFFGIYCVVIGILIYRSRLMPRFIGVLMAIGGVAYLVSSFMIFLWPAVAARLPDFTILGGIAELVLSLWLMIRGVHCNTTT